MGNFKYPRGKRKFSTWASNNTSEESNETSEEWNETSEEFAVPSVENLNYLGEIGVSPRRNKIATRMKLEFHRCGNLGVWGVGLQRDLDPRESHQ